MQEPTDPSFTQFISGEAQTDKSIAISGDGDLGSKAIHQNDATGNDATVSTVKVENGSPDEEGSESKPAVSAEPAMTLGQGGRAVKMQGLTAMLDLMRPGSDRKILLSLFTASEDGTIKLVMDSEIEHNGRRNWVPRMPPVLYRSLVLPTDVHGFRSARDLFDSILALLRKHVMLPEKERSLLTYWSMATWFPDFLPFFPCLAISGPASTADLLLRTLVAVLRRPLLLADVSPAVLCALPLGELTPTLLIREPQLSKRMAALLDASNQPGYLVSSGKDFQQLYCPKCIYVGERVQDQLITTNSIQIHVGGNSPGPLHPLPTEDVIRDFQNRLLTYRLLGHDKVAASKFRVSAFRPEVCAMAEVLGAAIVDDPELQRGIIELLKERDEQSRVDRASGQNGVVLRAVLFHCHQSDHQKVFVREIAATVNQIYSEEGESLKVSSETVGHVLKNLGLYSRRLGNAGRGLMLDKPTQSRAHKLSHSYEVLPSVPACGYCHELQPLQSKEVV